MEAYEMMGHVIDGVDEATAMAILSARLSDIGELALESATDPFAVSDLQLALQLYEAELDEFCSGYGLSEKAQNGTDLESTTGDVNAIKSKEEVSKKEAAVIADSLTTEEIDALARAWSAEAAAYARSVQRFTCASCTNAFGADDCYQMPCTHYYCTNCLDYLYRQCCIDESLYPPRCCQTALPFDDINLFLPEATRALFEGKREELDDKQRLYCRVPTCSAYIGHSHRESTTAICPKCYVQRCLACDNGPHEGSCEENTATQAVKELAENEGWRSCPSCGVLIELVVGCNHMTCRCRTEFCYVCRLPWKTCLCPQWDEGRLYARAHDVAHRENDNANVADIQAAAAHLRVRHQCNHTGRWAKIYEAGLECDECHDELARYIFRCRRCHLQACNRCRLNRL